MADAKQATDENKPKKTKKPYEGKPVHVAHAVNAEGKSEILTVTRDSADIITLMQENRELRIEVFTDQKFK